MGAGYGVVQRQKPAEHTCLVHALRAVIIESHSCGHGRCRVSSWRTTDGLICLWGLSFIFPGVVGEFSKEGRREGTIGFGEWSVSCRVAEPACSY